MCVARSPWRWHEGKGRRGSQIRIDAMAPSCRLTRLPPSAWHLGAGHLISPQAPPSSDARWKLHPNRRREGSHQAQAGRREGREEGTSARIALPLPLPAAHLTSCASPLVSRSFRPARVAQLQLTRSPFLPPKKERPGTGRQACMPEAPGPPHGGRARCIGLSNQGPVWERTMQDEGRWGRTNAMQAAGRAPLMARLSFSGRK